MIESFVEVGDIIEVEYDNFPHIFTVEEFVVVPNALSERPTDFVIQVTFKSKDGGEISCTSDKFKYIRHIRYNQRKQREMQLETILS